MTFEEEFKEWMHDSALIGINYWRPGDYKRCQDIVGTELWDVIRGLGKEREAGVLFAKLAKQLGLVYVDKDQHRGRLYAKA